MSLARDDVGISRASNALISEPIKQGTLEKREKIDKISVSEKKKSEIKDVFEKEPINDIKSKSQKLEALQQEYNKAEEEEKILKEAEEELSNAEKSGETPDEEKLQEIEKALGKESSEKEKEDSESGKKINELRAEVNEKQQQLAELKQKLYHEVNSIVELPIGGIEESEESIEQKAEKIKNAAIDGINENPEKSREIQIKSLDKNLILAMLSLRK